MQNTHTHTVTTTSSPLPYRGPVARIENGAAHGGHRVIERCTCGAGREVNVNGHHEEVGPWIENWNAIESARARCPNERMHEELACLLYTSDAADE